MIFRRINLFVFSEKRAISLHPRKKLLPSITTRISKIVKSLERLNLSEPNNWQFLLFGPASHFRSEVARKPNTRKGKRFSKIGNTTPVFLFITTKRAVSVFL